ncbi:MAG: YcbK family protein [Sandaracinaceae bacterium]|nr:YcbK family protein [Sandaracinaceae bacterium]MBP7684307.1 YcbK family protein [Deltaproteobacteria bacterium]MBK7150409.1 YcbK family protein [Sandaracinaceae bacterium]MBK7777253.1 YcbK family protein [Sandaracinaceae bacterium]MBK8408753.1 YcbK family protein [Sandaracinaceae bacterium]
MLAEPPPAPTLAETPADSQAVDELPDYSRKAARRLAGDPRTQRFDVTFWNIHTRELLPVPTDGLPGAADLSRFLRCRVTGDQSPMSPAPFAIAANLARREGRPRVHVVSGYRSPKLNAHLRKKGRDVAEASYHMLGSALDFRIPGVPTRRLTTHLEDTHEGGVGRYPHSNFVHVDDGPRRRWRGQ